jgi:hypothetical protein
MNGKLLRLACALCCAAYLMCGSPFARAEAPDAPEYRALVTEALAEFDSGHFAEARALFLHAHALNPSARTLRGLGLSSFELREYRASIEYLEQALASQVNPLQGELRTGTEQILRRAYGFVGRFTPRLEPTHARLRVDGVPLGSLPSVLLEIGMHVVTAEAQGYLSETRNLQVMGGEDTVLMMSLPAVPGAMGGVPAPLPAVSLPSANEGEASPLALSTASSGPPPQGQADDGTRPPLYKNAWLWSGVAVAVVAAVVVGSVVAANNNGDKTKVADPTSSGNSTNVVLSGLGVSL